MLDYAGLEALAAVVREGSFERAAHKLHVTPSAVSQRIKQLEERVGQALVLRGQPCTGTGPGGACACMWNRSRCWKTICVARTPS